MSDDMKLVLRELEKINQRMDDMHDDLNGKINDLNAIHDDLNGKMNAMHDDLNGKMNAMHDDLNGKIIELQKANTRIQLLIENDLSKKIDIIGEGHDFLNRKLDDTLQMKAKWEGVALEQINQRIELNKVKDHLGIA